MIGTYSAPYNPVPVKQRNEAFIEPIFTTIIRLANGTDVSASFRTMVYWQPHTPASSNSSLNGRQAVQRINYCQTPTARFIHSRCQRFRGLQVSLRDYVVFCREYPFSQYNPSDGIYETVVTREEGACGPREHCVDDLELQIATCVNLDEESETTDSAHQDSHNSQVNGYSKGSQQGSNDPDGGRTNDFSQDIAGLTAGRGLGNKRVGIIVSAADGITPLGLQNLEVDLGIESGSQTCQHCFGLRTQKAAADADFLTTKATLLATTAVTGFIWVTVFAG